MASPAPERPPDPRPEAAPSADAAWRRVTAVIVTHHSGAVIRQCLESVARARKIVVVDNASTDDTLSIVADAAPGADVVRNAVGVGYGNGASQGLERVETEFALLMNPDAAFEGEALATLVAAADEYPEAGLLSPLLIGDGGRYDRAWDASFAWRDAMNRDRSAEPRPEGPFCTWVVSGAVNLVRTDAMRRVGFFDRAIFLYYEDDDICTRLRAAGYALLVVPGAVARHVGGGSIRAGWDKHWEKFFHVAWSRLYYEAKCHSPAAARRLGLRHAARYGAKAVLYALALNLTKASRDAARFAGSAAYLLGIPASRTTKRARPEKTP